jgi:hypothetical protein
VNNLLNSPSFYLLLFCIPGAQPGSHLVLTLPHSSSTGSFSDLQCTSHPWHSWGALARYFGDFPFNVEIAEGFLMIWPGLCVLGGDNRCEAQFSWLFSTDAKPDFKAMLVHCEVTFSPPLNPLKEVSIKLLWILYVRLVCSPPCIYSIICNIQTYKYLFYTHMNTKL